MPNHAIPDDEHAGIIAIEIARVGGMMNASDGWAVFITASNQRGMRFIASGMDPELVDEVEPAADRDHRRVEAQ